MRFVGIDPDPIGATFVVLMPGKSGHFDIEHWGLVRQEGAAIQHALQIAPSILCGYLHKAIVGIEVVDRVIGRYHKGILHTQKQGQHLLKLAQIHANVVYSFPGRYRGNTENRFQEGPWPPRLTGLYYATREDIKREILSCVPDAHTWIHNPHLLDALGVALLAGRLAARASKAS